MICPACGAPAADDARFCAACGRSLRAADDERRVVTVLFADIVGFTALSERLDPERVKNLVDRCFDLLAEDVGAFGGQVDKVVGDALVALFGAPIAHEDDAERAVRAALRMQETLRDEAEAIGEELRIRVGVNTGEVLVGTMRAAGSVTAMGDVVNTASRLQAAAEPGEVLVGPATRAATHQAIAYESRGLLMARGREEPVDTWLALAPTAAPGYRARRIDLPLVGRDREMGTLRHVVDTSLVHGRALFVLLLGDVGMGKSRLADEVASWAGMTHGALEREGRCLPYGEANVWWPVADAIRDGLRVADGDDLATATATIRHQVATVLRRDVDDAEVVRTAAGLLLLLGYDPPNVDPANARDESVRSIGVYANALGELRPLVLQISDLHWADDALLDLLDQTMTTVHRRPIVVVSTARPNLTDRWTPRPGRYNTLVMHVDPLDREAAAQMLETLVGGPVPADVATAILDRSGGNPFYIEELVSLLDGAISSGVVPESLDVGALPDTLRGVVAARLDDLDPATRSVLQDAAVIGQRGPVAGLREMAVKLKRGIDVDSALARLVADEIMERQGEGWAFRSHLVREVAYQTLTKADRAESHLGIARYLEHSVTGSPRPAWLVDQLAHHYRAAATLARELGPTGRTGSFPPELAAKARRWLVESAERARTEQAMSSAARLYGQALALVAADETSSEEAVRLRVARASAASEAWDLGVAKAEVDSAVGGALSAGLPALHAEALVVRGRVEQRAGDVDAAVATLTEAEARFRALGLTAGRSEALRQRAMVQIMSGELDDASLSAAEALAGFEEVGDLPGQGWAMQHQAWIDFMWGHTEQADDRLRAAAECFETVGDTRGLAWSRGLLAWVRYRMGRVEEATELGQEVLTEATARRDPWAMAMMTLLIGSVRLRAGAAGEAVELAGEARRTFDRLGDAYGQSQARVLQGRALVMIGRVGMGFEVLDEAAARSRGRAARRAVGLARLASALQVGEPHRAADVLSALQRSSREEVNDDLLVPQVVGALQTDDVDRAVALVAGIDPESEGGRPDHLAAAALVASACHRGAAARFADLVDAAPGATYLERATASVAAAVEAGRRGDAAAVAQRLDGARAAAAESDDVVAQALVGLAAAVTASQLGSPDAEADAEAAARRFAAIGVEPAGWTLVFERACGGS